MEDEGKKGSEWDGEEPNVGVRGGQKFLSDEGWEARMLGKWEGEETLELDGRNVRTKGHGGEGGQERSNGRNKVWTWRERS